MAGERGGKESGGRESEDEREERGEAAERKRSVCG